MPVSSILTLTVLFLQGNYTLMPVRCNKVLKVVHKLFVQFSYCSKYLIKIMTDKIVLLATLHRRSSHVKKRFPPVILVIFAVVSAALMRTAAFSCSSRLKYTNGRDLVWQEATSQADGIRCPPACRMETERLMGQKQYNQSMIKARSDCGVHGKTPV